MSRDHKFRTTLRLSIFDGGETELALLIVYRFERAYPATAIDPGSDASVEIHTVRLFSKDRTREFSLPVWIDEMINADEALRDSLVAHALEDDAEARAYRMGDDR